MPSTAYNDFFGAGAPPMPSVIPTQGPKGAPAPVNTTAPQAVTDFFSSGVPTPGQISASAKVAANPAQHVFNPNSTIQAPPVQQPTFLQNLVSGAGDVVHAVKQAGQIAYNAPKDFVNGVGAMYSNPSPAEQQIEKATTNPQNNDFFTPVIKAAERTVSPVTANFLGGAENIAQNIADKQQGVNGNIDPALYQKINKTAAQSTPAIETDPKAFLDQTNSYKDSLLSLSNQLDKTSPKSKNYNTLVKQYNDVVNSYEGNVKAIEGYSAKTQLQGFAQNASQYKELPFVGLSANDFSSALNLGGAVGGLFELFSPAAKTAALKLSDIAAKDAKIPITHQDMRNITVGNEAAVDPKVVEAYKKAAAENQSLKTAVQQGYIQLSEKHPTMLSNALKNVATRPVSEAGNLTDTYGAKINVPDTKLIQPFSHETPPVENSVKPFSEANPAVDNTHEPFTGNVKNQLPDKVIQTPTGFKPIPLDTAASTMAAANPNSIITQSPSMMEQMGHANEGGELLLYRGGTKLDQSQISDRGVPLTTDNKVAETFSRYKNQWDAGPIGQIQGKQPGQNFVETYKLSPDTKIATKSDIPSDIYQQYKESNPMTNPAPGETMLGKWAKENGFDAIDYRTLGDTSLKESEIKVLNTEKLIPKYSTNSDYKSPQNTQINPQQGSANPGQMFSDIGDAVKKFQAGIADTKAGEALRTKYVGNVNSRIAMDNHLFDSLEHIIKTPHEQEALNLYRNFKGKPGELQQFLDGTHPEFQKALDNFKAHNPDATEKDLQAFKENAVKDIQRFSKVIQLAINPSSSIVAVDKAFSDYYKNKLAEGQKGGFLDSSINPDTYINQMTTPKTIKKGVVGGARQGTLGGKFDNSMARVFESPLHAMANNFRNKTLNSIALGRIYAQRFATVAGTHDFLNELKDVQLAGMDDKNVPQGWKDVHIGRKIVYLPEKLADALAPLLDKSGVPKDGLLGKITNLELVVKAGEVSASIFHYKALTLTASSSMGPVEAAKSAIGTDLTSPRFKSDEIDFIKNGGLTSEVGKTIEAYKLAERGTAVTPGQILKETPGIKQALELSDALTKATFDIAQRKFKVDDFALQRDAWIVKHPNATEEQLGQAKRDIAKLVNSVYGGLNWDVLGVSKFTRGFARAMFFAPDWTYSNILTGKYAFTGGAARGRALKFFLYSAATTYALTQAMSLLISKKMSKHPFKVYLGKDKNGKEVYSNWFGVGAFGDLITLLTNVQNKGLLVGTATTAGNKMGSVGRTLVHLMTNENYLHQPITIKGASPAVNTVRAGLEVASENTPVPFALTDSIKLITDKKSAATFWDYVSLLAGQSATHEVPDGSHVPTTGVNKGQVVQDKTNNRPKENFMQQVLHGGTYVPGTKNTAGKSSPSNRTRRGK